MHVSTGLVFLWWFCPLIETIVNVELRAGESANTAGELKFSWQYNRNGAAWMHLVSDLRRTKKKITPKAELLTVDDGNVSVLVEFWQCDRGSRDRGHSSYGPAVVGAVEVARRQACLVACTDSSISTGQPTTSQASTHAVREAERISCTVSTVWLVDPLHHGSLGWHTRVLTR